MPVSEGKSPKKVKEKVSAPQLSRVAQIWKYDSIIYDQFLFSGIVRHRGYKCDDTNDGEASEAEPNHSQQIIDLH